MLTFEISFCRGSQLWTEAYVMEFRDLINSTPLEGENKSEEAKFLSCKADMQKILVCKLGFTQKYIIAEITWKFLYMFANVFSQRLATHLFKKQDQDDSSYNIHRPRTSQAHSSHSQPPLYSPPPTCEYAVSAREGLSVERS